MTSDKQRQVSGMRTRNGGQLDEINRDRSMIWDQQKQINDMKSIDVD